MNFFTPQVACPRCHREDWSYEESAGRGFVSSFTVVHRPPTEGHDPPYVVAVIDLDEDWYMMSNVVGCAPDTVHIGQRVAVTWHVLDSGVVLPVFAPDEQEAT